MENHKLISVSLPQATIRRLREVRKSDGLPVSRQIYIALRDRWAAAGEKGGIHG